MSTVLKSYGISVESSWNIWNLSKILGISGIPLELTGGPITKQSGLSQFNGLNRYTIDIGLRIVKYSASVISEILEILRYLNVLGSRLWKYVIIV